MTAETTHPGWTEDRKAALQRYLEVEGLSYRRAARRLSVTRNAAIGVARREGFQPRAWMEVPQNLRAPPSPSRKPGARRPPTLIREEIGLVGSGLQCKDLGPHDCKWPIGDPKSPAFHFCGEAKIEGSPYCVDHDKRAWEPAVPGAKHRTRAA